MDSELAEKPKKSLFKTVILLVLIIVLGGVGYVVYSKYHNQSSNFISEKSVNLTEEQRKIYTDRLADADGRLAKANTNDERYDIYVYQGYQYYGLGQLASAKSSYLKAIALNSKKYQAFVALHQTQLDMQDFAGAKDSILKAIDNFPTNGDLWNKYILLEKENFGASTERQDQLYQEALSKTNNNSDVLVTYATFLESIGKVDQAITQWQKAIEVNSKDKVIYEQEIARLKALPK